MSMLPDIITLVRARQPFVVEARVPADASPGAHRRAMTALRQAQSCVLDLDAAWSADAELNPIDGEYAVHFRPVPTTPHPVGSLVAPVAQFLTGAIASVFAFRFRHGS